MVVRIQVTSFSFCASRDTRSEGCQDSFDQAEAILIYTIEGHPEYDTNKQPGIPREPVTALKRDGWEQLHKPCMGFKRAAEFEKLTLAVPVDCRCACGGKVQVKHLKWEVNYDRSGTGGPTMTLHSSVNITARSTGLPDPRRRWISTRRKQPTIPPLPMFRSKFLLTRSQDR
jgi:hypothetical protein